MPLFWMAAFEKLSSIYHFLAPIFSVLLWPYFCSPSPVQPPGLRWDTSRFLLHYGARHLMNCFHHDCRTYFDFQVACQPLPLDPAAVEFAEVLRVPWQRTRDCIRWEKESRRRWGRSRQLCGSRQIFPCRGWGNFSRCWCIPWSSGWYLLTRSVYPVRPTKKDWCCLSCQPLWLFEPRDFLWSYWVGQPLNDGIIKQVWRI